MTYGEDLVSSLLNKLPKGEYYVFPEPKIVSTSSSKQNPDFVIASAKLGIFVIEVKDWIDIRKFGQKKIQLKRPNGTIEEETNPLVTAKEYAHNLAERFQKRKELLCKHDGRNKLAFPWMNAAILTHLDNKFIRECEDRGIWNKGEVLGKDDLTEERFENALLQIPVPWRMKSLLSADILDIIRGVIEPEYIVPDSSGNDVGTITTQQARLITEPLRVREPQSPKQKVLLDPDFLTTEAKETIETVSVRLVRGVAGSGKSLVLARRANYLAETYPNLDILVMAFNVDLVEDLRKRILKATISTR